VAGAREYGICLVDTAGSPFTDLLGPLKLVLDPFTLYRTFPGQRTPHFSVDANGYRGAFDPADPRPRVLVLGGSAAFGWGLRSDDETFAARLDRLDAGRRYVNGAVTGFLSGQELSEMVHRGDRLPAAGYVVFDGWNEQYVGLFPGYEGRDFGYNRQVFASIEERLRLARRAAGAKLPPATPTPAPLDAQANQREILAAYTRNLRRMAEVARARRAFLLVVFQPQLGTKRRLAGGEAQAIEVWRKAYTRTHAGFAAQYAAQVASAAAFCEREGIACLDLESSPVFRDSENELFVDTVHLNGEGHRLVAREIRSRLARLLGS
jgi:hypothetical protein